MGIGIEQLTLAPSEANSKLSKDDFSRYQVTHEIHSAVKSINCLETISVAVNVVYDKSLKVEVFLGEENPHNVRTAKYIPDFGIVLPIKFMGEGLHILYALFHELGHALDDTNVFITLEREQYAWNKARELLESFLESNNLNNGFEDHANYCLLEYEKLSYISEKVQQLYEDKFGKPLKDGLNGHEFAKLCDVDEYLIVMLMMANQTPADRTLEKIAQGLSVKVSDLILSN